MRVMTNEAVISLEDIRCVSVSCLNCKTKVLLDLREKSDHADRYGLTLPGECPVCRKPYDSALNGALTSLQVAYDAVRVIENRLSFRGDAG